MPAVLQKTPLALRLFGPFTATVGDSPLPRLRSQKGEWLLALLALRNGQPAKRSWLAGTLWPDSDEGRALFYLRRELSVLRQALGPEQWRVITKPGQTLTLDLEGASCDVLEFDDAIARGGEIDLKSAVELYRGAVLEGCTEEWVFQERNAREAANVDALERLAEAALVRGELDRTTVFLRLVLSVDPLRETAQRALIQTLANRGDYSAAVQAYRDLRLLLRSELNTEPDPATTAVYRSVCDSAKQTASFSPAPAKQPAIRRLPSPITELIGRGEELREIASAVSNSRMVTLTGSGGIGKTRLAIHTAGLLAESFPDGAWFVDLASVTEPEVLGQTVAAALNILCEAGQSYSEAVRGSLRSKRILIVLDNCEQIIDVCATLAQEILASSPGAHILATSRQALGITGELAWRVPSLDTPPEIADAPFGREKNLVAELMDYASVRLFVDRAQQASPDFAVTSSNSRAIVQICRRLEGIPLALELAAARTRALSVEEVANRLDDRFRLLTTGSRTAMPRQKTLHAAIEWSFELLEPAERALLQRLTVFCGGWTLASAAQVCSDDGIPEEDILDVLSALVDKSLVIRYLQEGETRYRFLESVREFGRAELMETEWNRLRERHADFFYSMTKDAALIIEGPDFPRLDRQLDLDLDNLRAQMDWWLATNNTDRAVLSSAILHRYWTDRGYQEEGRSRILRAVEAAPTISLETRTSALKVLGMLSNEMGDVESATAFHEEALRIHEKSGIREAVASAHNDVGSAAMGMGNYEQARHHFELALQVNRELDLPVCQAFNLGNLASVAADTGDFAKAVELYEQGLATVRQVGANRAIPAFLGLMGAAYRRLGNHERAEELLAEALSLTREQGNRAWEPNILFSKAMLEMDRGNFEDCRHALLQAFRVARRSALKQDLARLLEGMAALAARVDESDRAVVMFASAAALRRAIRTPVRQCDEKRHGREVENLRDSLGTERFEKRWAEGSAMTLENAVNTAMEFELV